MAVKNKKDFREEDLYRPIHDHLCESGYTVRSEVKHCDIAAVKDDRLLVVEMKKNLNLEVILQATLRQKLTDLVYIAVPKPGRDLYSKRWSNLSYLLKRLQLGLIVVSLKEDCSLVEVLFEPVPFDMERTRKRSARKKQELIKEFESRYGDFNTGGCTGKKLVTAYREMAVQIACCLIEHGPMKPKALRGLGTDEKKTTTILAKNHYGWFDRVSTGLYGINEKGCKEVLEYRELYEYYMGLMSSIKPE